ncbi:MAG TPA: MerR family transcriptional regulator [Candidatus Dormibacteraeota bacterium]|nr:MerR family transcriptional regulator [Candidatus Dormibacteraeota bacterium]
MVTTAGSLGPGADGAGPTRDGGSVPARDLRLTQLALTTGLSAQVIRVWERRYQFPQPTRTTGGHRRYSQADAVVLLQVAALVHAGFRPREALARVREGLVSPLSPGTLTESLQRLLSAGESGPYLLDLLRADAVMGFEQALEAVVLPTLQTLTEAAERGEISVAQEHAVAHVILIWLGSARAALRTPPPVTGRVVLAAPGRHPNPLTLTAMELALTARGVPVTLLGSIMPPEAVAEAVRLWRPAAVFLCCASQLDRSVVARAAAVVARLEAAPPCFVGGPGLGSPPMGAIPLPKRVAQAADQVAAALGAGSRAAKKPSPQLQA